MSKITINNNSPRLRAYYIGNRLINILPGLNLDCMDSSQLDALIKSPKHPILEQIASGSIVIIKSTPDIGITQINEVDVTKYQGEEIPVHLGDNGGKVTQESATLDLIVDSEIVVTKTRAKRKVNQDAHII